MVFPMFRIIGRESRRRAGSGDCRSEPSKAMGDIMRVDTASNRHRALSFAATDAAAKCPDCAIPMRTAARITDPHTSQRCVVYQCDFCARLEWEADD